MMYASANVGYSESRNEDNRGGEDVNKAIRYLFSDRKTKRIHYCSFTIVAYKHVTKHVANVDKQT